MISLLCAVLEVIGYSLHTYVLCANKVTILCSVELLTLRILNCITATVLFPATHTCHPVSKTTGSNCNIHCCKYEYIVNTLTNKIH